MLTAKLAIENTASGIGWDEAEPATEKRAALRFTLLIRTAKLIAPDGEFFCVVRDASQDEMTARVFLPLLIPEGTPLIVEFGNGERLPVIKIWQDGDIAGFRFLQPVAIDRLLADAPEGLQKRSVRLRLALPATLTVAGRPIPATYRDISQHGACLHCEERLPVNARIALASRGSSPARSARPLAPRTAVRGDFHAGVPLRRPRPAYRLAALRRQGLTCC